MIPFSTSALNVSWWKHWARECGSDKLPVSSTGFMGSLKTLTPYIGKKHAASLVHLGFLFKEPFQIPGVGLVQLDQISNEKLYFGQAPALHWLALNDPTVNSALRSLGISQWWSTEV